MSDFLEHYGVKRRSGRYPWGSGKDGFLSTVKELESNGLTELEIAKSFGISTTEFRNKKSLEKSRLREEQKRIALKHKSSGMSTAAISREMNVPETTIRNIINNDKKTKFKIVENIANQLKSSVEKYEYIDVGDGVEQWMGVSKTKLKNAIYLLEEKGYKIQYVRQEQLATGKKTSIKVLTKEDLPYEVLSKNRHKIQIPNNFTEDGGITFLKPKKISNIESDRIHIVYGDEGGADKDGFIGLRRNVPDLSLQGNRYAQVRIGVNGDLYLKGMAAYDDNIPQGKDIVFYTNKQKNSTDPLNVLKKQDLSDPSSPFGAVTKPAKTFLDKDGKIQQSAINIVNEEGDWSNWSKNLSSQFLSKQHPRIAKNQLEIQSERFLNELKEIESLTNPTVKKHLLLDLADTIDSASVHLKAAALPRQTTSVIIPGTTLKDNEIYAPNYANGDVVSLIRYPHAGTFEIPTLTVNNKNSEMRSILGTSPIDAVGINPKVAKRLSGADYDGDTVVIIPNDKKQVKTSPAIKSLQNFDPIDSYPYQPGMKIMGKQSKQKLMGDISNLITDMTIRGASQDEIARATRHSMVVIDAEKHRLNYEQSYVDNGISALKRKYQGGSKRGASTIVSKASSEERVPLRKEHYDIDPKTGEKVYIYTHEVYIDKRGRQIERTTKSTKLAETSDAHTLSSGTLIEKVYADHSNKLKGIANRARLSYLKTEDIKYSSTARITYKKEVDSLNAKLREAEKHQPLERKAQLLGNVIYKKKLELNPAMSGADKKKEKGRSLVTARGRLGATRPIIDITPREWEAINMGAITKTKLSKILRNSDSDKVRSLSTPRINRTLSNSQKSRVGVLLKAGYTSAEVASVLGVPVNLLNVTHLDDFD